MGGCRPRRIASWMMGNSEGGGLRTSLAGWSSRGESAGDAAESDLLPVRGAGYADSSDGGAGRRVDVGMPVR